ncbi:hypothetical protein [Candidatus Sororendozoicomonas aggregata]|uniref:hypothetical protein n=1 Tax=Candidatus Sororendozoicomonas aggregata TaxID=3073239 RepID=UPI002ED1DE36
MNKLLLVIATFISAVLLTSPGFAHRSEHASQVNTTNNTGHHFKRIQQKDRWYLPAPRDPNYLQVNFNNHTPTLCKITGEILVHGDWDSTPPKLYDNINEASYWVATIMFGYGPKIDMTFKCGPYSFSTINQQNLSVLAGGNQHNSTYNVDKHLRVTNEMTQHASFADSLPGIAEINVSFK